MGPRFIPDWFSQAVVLLIIMDVMLHPVTYGFRSRDFKTAFSKMFKRKRKVIQHHTCLKWQLAEVKRKNMQTAEGCRLKITYV